MATHSEQREKRNSHWWLLRALMQARQTVPDPGQYSQKKKLREKTQLNKSLTFFSFWACLKNANLAPDAAILTGKNVSLKKSSVFSFPKNSAILCQFFQGYWRYPLHVLLRGKGGTGCSGRNMCLHIILNWVWNSESKVHICFNLLVNS